MRVLTQKSVPWMNRIDVGDFCRGDQSVDTQIAIRGRPLADANSFVSHLNVHRTGISLRIHGDRFDIKFPARTDDPHGNFTTVCDQDFFEHG